jgi:rubrerythrin
MLRKIFVLCRSIELAAETAYLKFSNETEADEQKSFWLEISRNEKGHATYREQLLELEENGSIQNPFENPERIVS